MTASSSVRRLAWLLLGTALALGGCVAGGVYDDGGYVGTGVDVDYGVGYYGPCCGWGYHGWHRGYGPPPRGGFPHHEATARAHAPAYRPAHSGHGMPSLPHPRSH